MFLHAITILLLRNPIFCDFLGGGGGQDPLSPPGLEKAA